MPDLETFVIVASCAITLSVWIPWYAAIFRVHRLRCSTRSRLALAVAPILCLLFVGIILAKFASQDVRVDPLYLAFYLTAAAAWVGATTLFFPLLGISMLDDVLERGTSGAVWAVVGALVGATGAFAGANIGNGPGVEAVLFSALLSSGLLLLLWFVLELTTHISEAITVDRNTGSGIRLGGFLIALGILSGCSVAGDWVSASATARDFLRFCWPAVIVAILAISVERLGRARWEESRSNDGMSALVALLYVTLAVVWAISRGLQS